jgi:uncharacterized protein YdaU (DUF1376 family)
MMRFYPFHVGDYQAHTSHLTDTEDLAYRRMLDLYYLNQKPLPNDPARIARLIRMPGAVTEIDGLLKEFFVLQDDVYTNKRCDKEIASFTKQKVGGAKGARIRWDKAKLEGGDSLPNGEGNGEGIREGNATPIATKNQEPRTRESRATRLPPDWEPSDELIAFMRKERPDLNPSHTIMKFCNYWQAKSGKDATKLDWDKTFQNWVLQEKEGKAKPASQDPFASRGGV